MLVSQIEQVNKLQDAVENEADKAMTQLEEFINEQEKLVSSLGFHFPIHSVHCK